jgi:ribonuclease HI
MNLEIPDKFDIWGVKLSTLTQATAYKVILEWKQAKPRPTTKKNLWIAHTAIQSVMLGLETDTAIWNNTRKPLIWPLIQQFLYKTMHETHLVGKYWCHINGYEEREMCKMCNETESMAHILTWCKERNTQLIWHLAENLWPYRHIPWPVVTLRTILGYSSMNLHPTRPKGCNQ